VIDRTIEYPVGDDPPSARLIYGLDVVDGLKMLEDESIQVVCTSPPYWGLRDYGTGDAQFGLEQSPQEYVARLVEIFREIRRVLRPDGVVWLNLGDSYIGGGSSGHMATTTNMGRPTASYGAVPTGGRKVADLKPKDLAGIPWRVALALQDDGWWLRQEVIWAKANCMPEPVKDRCTRNHETIFMLTKSARYFYDHIAIKEPCGPVSAGNTSRKAPSDIGQISSARGVSPPWDATTASGRNKRTVWNVNPRPYPGAHFACWPPELVEPMIKAGSSEKGCCSKCGKPMERMVERTTHDDPGRGGGAKYRDLSVLGRQHDGHRMLGSDYQAQLNANPPRTVGWEPCPCTNPAKTRRCVVLDPFCGSATTGMVAMRLGRDFIGIDLNEDYIELAESRLLGRKIKKGDLEDGGLLEMFSEGGP
jgi:DNA modification methylase